MWQFQMPTDQRSKNSLMVAEARQMKSKIIWSKSFFRHGLNLNEMKQAGGGFLPILLRPGKLSPGGVIIAIMHGKKKK